MLWIRAATFGRLRRPVAVAALGAYLFAALGLPMPAWAPARDGQPFPCHDHSCGCLTAEQCWRNCCCFTPEERFAWAKAHGIEPPAYAAKPKPAGWRAPRLRDRAADGEGASACCRKGTADPAAKAGEQSSTCCSGHGERADRGCEKRPVRMPAVSPLRCRGLTAAWSAFAGGVVPPPVPTWRASPPLVAVLPVGHTRPRTVVSAPPTPPPRCV
jgi:hypothetical protein